MEGSEEQIRTHRGNCVPSAAKKQEEVSMQNHRFLAAWEELVC